MASTNTTTTTAASSTGTSGTGFDPQAQTITLLLPGNTSMPIPLADIDSYTRYGIRICINYASQVGASLLLLAVLLLLTQPDKRRTPLFLLNALALLANATRLILGCIYFTSSYYTFYTYFSGDYSGTTASNKATSIAADLLTLLVLAALEASLLIQVAAVTTTLRHTHKLALQLTCGALALAAIGTRFALTVLNARAIAHNEWFTSYAPLAAAATDVATASICVFSAVFVGKLGLAVRARRRLGLRALGAMRVVAIGGAQTLLVPAVFAVLQNFTAVPELGSQVLTLVALSLPLTSLWAAATVAEAGSAGVALAGSSRRSLLGVLRARVMRSRRAGAGAGASAVEMAGVGVESVGSGATAATAEGAKSPSERSQGDGDEDDAIERDMRVHLGRSMV